MITIGAAAYFTLSYIFFPESIDDAYIGLRFAENLSLLEGPIFNIGEQVEGFSNPLWVLILGVLAFLGFPIEISMKILGFFLGLATLWLVLKLSRLQYRSNVAVVFPFLLISSSSFFALWAVDGLETVFYTFLLTSLVYLLSNYRAHQIYLIGLVATAVALTRPEGVMFSCLSFAFITHREGMRKSVLAAVPFVLVFGGYLLFRFSYYDSLLPNTANVKLHPGKSSVLAGFHYVRDFNSASGYMLLALLIVGAFTLKRSFRAGILGAFICAQMFFVLMAGGDFMFGYRFIMPIAPCIALLASGTIVLVERMSGKAALSLAMIVVCTQAVVQFESLPKKHIGLDNFSYRSSPHFAIGRYIQENSSSKDWIALSEAGIIPYYSRTKVVDFIGLVSGFYDIHDDDGTINTDYVFSKQPKYIVLSFTESKLGEIEPRMYSERMVMRHPEFQNLYAESKIFEMPKNDSFLNAIYYHYWPNAARIFFVIFERENS
jgi:arabinofuranosyltransferase